MKKIWIMALACLFVIFAACSGGDYNEGDDSNDNEPTYDCGNGICENGETHENCKADCPRKRSCEDANENGICDSDERLARYCYDHSALDAIYGDTIHWGQFSSPSPTLGWEGDNDVVQLLKGSDTVCFLSKAWPIVERGYESLYGDVTAGKLAQDKWMGYSLAPISIEVQVGDTTATRPVLPYFAGLGYHACLDEEAPLCWENLCTVSTSGELTCYNEVGAVDNECGSTKKCQLCVEHCQQLYDILSP